MKEIYDVLHTMQKELKAPKGQNNNFGKYKYRSCEDIVEAVKKILPEGYVLILGDEMIMLGDRFYVKAKAALTSDGMIIEAYGYARESLDKKGMDAAQITGAASSYARKYALNGLFAIDDTKDADTNEYRKKVDAAPKPPKETPTQVRDKLIARIETFADTAKLSDWERNQKVRDARDQLHLDSVKMSAEVDTAITKKQATFLQLPSNLS